MLVKEVRHIIMWGTSLLLHSGKTNPIKRIHLNFIISLLINSLNMKNT